MTSQAAESHQGGHRSPGAADALQPLLLAAAAGCADSFAQLYAQTHRRVFGIVLRIMRHRAEAEEVLQEVYVKVWFRSAQFDPRRGRAVHWLAGIAHCASIDALRRRDSRPREVNPGSDDDDDPYRQFRSSQPGPTERLEEADTQRAVHRQLSTLPDEQRESLALAFFDGLTHAEIAKKLQCPLGTVKSRVRRALISLRPGLQLLQ